MADSKKYYYLKLKENFFDSDDMKLLQAMKDGYMIWTETALNAKVAVELIALMYLSFLVSTNGYDKVVQAIKQIQSYTGGCK